MAGIAKNKHFRLTGYGLLYMKKQGISNNRLIIIKGAYNAFVTGVFAFGFFYLLGLLVNQGIVFGVYWQFVRFYTSSYLPLSRCFAWLFYSRAVWS
jgi:hypothetical protein